MNRNLQLPTELKHLAGGMRAFLCALLVLSVVLSAAPPLGFGRATSAPVPAEEHEEQQSVTFGCVARTALRRAAEAPFHLALKGRARRTGASNAIVGAAFRQGHRLPNGLMAPLRC